MILHPLIPSAKAFRLTFLCALLLAGAKSRAVAQSTTIATASFNSDGTVNAGNTYTLDTFLVTGTYYGTSASTAFISDGSGVSARIYGSSTVATLTVGSEYTATVTTSNYQNSQEFTATNVAPAGMFTAITVPTVSPSDVSTSTAVPLSPSAGTYDPLLYSGVSFTLTPQSGTTLTTTGAAVSVIDSTTGATLSLYRSEAATVLTAGQAYTVTGTVQSFNGDAEIVSAIASPAAAPEPGSWVACALGGTVLAGIAARRRSAARCRS